MSILTKICVVLLAVLTPLACAAFISMATVAPDWKDRAEKAGGQVDLLTQQNVHREMALQLARNERDEALAAAAEKSRGYDRHLADLQDQNAALRTTLAGLQATVDSMQAERKLIASTVLESNRRYDAMVVQAGKYRKTINDLTIENTRLGFLDKETRSKLDRSGRVVMVL